MTTTVDRSLLIKRLIKHCWLITTEADADWFCVLLPPPHTRENTTNH
jgi:hypothetical protein